MRNTVAPQRPAASQPLLPLLAGLFLILIVGLAAAGNLPAVTLGAVQGLGEFLPISSSAHLILVPWLFGWEGGSVGTLTFDVALHLGTLVAVVGYFWRDWAQLGRAVPDAARWALRGGRGPLSQREVLLIAIIIGTVPGAIIGKLMQDAVEGPFRFPPLLAVTLTLMGLLLWLADSRMPQRRSLEQLSWRDAIMIGLAQAAAIVPGVSRSGATMTAARVLGFDRAAAARFSFLLSAPITLAAVIVKLPDMLTISSAELPTFIIGVIVSGGVGALSIHFLLGYIRRIGFGVFAIYRIALALTIVIVYLLRQ